MKLHNQKLTSRDYKKEDTTIRIGSQNIGEGNICLIAGPCSLESKKQGLDIAQIVKNIGLNFFRAGVFKARTSPYSFQGLKQEGLKILSEIRKQFGLLTVSEITDSSQLSSINDSIDIVQIGSRNMQNFELLKSAAHTNRPVLLKRHYSAKISELLDAAEYIMNEGNHQIILCERGIRTFETATRNTFDINAIPVLKDLTHLPIVADPSHGTGIRSIVPSIGKAALIAGADGLLVEAHPNPDIAMSDGKQSLSPPMLTQLVLELRNKICPLLNKKFI